MRNPKEQAELIKAEFKDLAKKHVEKIIEITESGFSTNGISFNSSYEPFTITFTDINSYYKMILDEL